MRTGKGNPSVSDTPALVGIGNAIVDVIARAQEEFLARHRLRKGTMRLIVAAQAEALYEDMGPGIEMSGGSVANSIAGFAMLGGRAAFIGKVAEDQLGEVFGHDIRSLGVHFATPPAPPPATTARSLILVTPDAQRTMNTYLGASQMLNEHDLDEGLIARAEIVYLEGYLWDPPGAKRAFRRAIEVAKAAGTQVAFSLSDPFCVSRYRREFLELIDGGIDILFANEEEAKTLLKVDTAEEAREALKSKVPITALTRSEKGSWLIDRASGAVHEIPADPVERVEDTTGAGDLYAAGLLYGLTHGYALPQAGRIAARCAGEVVSHYGARPEADLKRLVADIARR
ncbi:MAG: adenosine kinase [Alphaproteobacteria bacterium]|nr:MAG: adenosine kinase [Alphaproteobacteria bacterium]